MPSNPERIKMVYDYEYFKAAVYKLTSIDLNAYKERQMKRRIDTLIAKTKLSVTRNMCRHCKQTKRCLKSLSII